MTFCFGSFKNKIILLLTNKRIYIIIKTHFHKKAKEKIFFSKRSAFKTFGANLICI